MCSNQNIKIHEKQLIKKFPAQFRLIRCLCMITIFIINLWSLQITTTLTEGPLFIFLQSGVEKLQAYGSVIEPTPLDLCSQSGAYDLTATVTSLRTCSMLQREVKMIWSMVVTCFSCKHFDATASIHEGRCIRRRTIKCQKSLFVKL